MKLIIHISLTAVVYFIFPHVGYAQVPSGFDEFVTQGNFDIIANTFLRIGLICSDSAYQGLAFCVIVFVTFVTGAIALKSAVAEGKDTYPWVKWFLSFVVGMAIYGVFVAKTSTFQVRDQTNNKFVTVTNIPDGIALYALVTNKISQVLVQLVDTTATPSAYGDNYISNPNGITFDAMSKVFDRGITLTSFSGVDATGSLNNANIQNYVNDCVLYEISSPASSYGMEEIDVNTDFLPIFSAAANPAILTTYYSDADKAGVGMTCADAWTNISAFLDTLNEGSTLVNDIYRERCVRAGFSERVSSAGGNDMTDQCRLKISGLIQSLLGDAFSSSHLIRQYLLASEIHNVVLSKSPDMAAKYMADRSMGTHLVNTGLIASEWMPILKGLLTGIFLGIMPFLLLLCATPLYGRVGALIFGSMVFFICWGVCEAILHQYAMDAAMDIMQEITRGRLGLRSMLMYGTYATKAYACFAPYQLLSFMLAGVISMSLTRFGGNAVSRIGMMQSQNIRSEATTGFDRAGDPAGSAATLGAYSSAMPTMTVHNENGYSGMATASYFNQASEIAAAHSKINSVGGGMHEAVKVHANIAGTSFQSTAGKTEAMIDDASLHGQSVKDVSYQNTTLGLSAVRNEIATGHELGQTVRETGANRGLATTVNSGAESRAVSEIGLGNYVEAAASNKIFAASQAEGRDIIHDETGMSVSDQGTAAAVANGVRSISQGRAVRNMGIKESIGMMERGEYKNASNIIGGMLGQSIIDGNYSPVLKDFVRDCMDNPAMRPFLQTLPVSFATNGDAQNANVLTKLINDQGASASGIHDLSSDGVSASAVLKVNPDGSFRIVDFKHESGSEGSHDQGTMEHEGGAKYSSGALLARENLGRFLSCRIFSEEKTNSMMESSARFVASGWGNVMSQIGSDQGVNSGFTDVAGGGTLRLGTPLREVIGNGVYGHVTGNIGHKSIEQNTNNLDYNDAMKCFYKAKEENTVNGVMNVDGARQSYEYKFNEMMAERLAKSDGERDLRFEDGMSEIPGEIDRLYKLGEKKFDEKK